MSRPIMLAVQAPVQPQAPSFNQVEFREGRIVATFAGEIGLTYIIERSSDMASWQTHQTIGPLAASERVSVELPAESDVSGFLRIRLAP